MGLATLRCSWILQEDGALLQRNEQNDIGADLYLVTATPDQVPEIQVDFRAAAGNDQQVRILVDGRPAAVITPGGYLTLIEKEN